MIVQFGGQTPLNLALRPRAGGRADPRHLAGRDRPRRGPRALRRAAREARAAPAAGRRRAQHGGSGAGGGADRLPGAGAALLRAGRPRHGDRLRRGRAARLHARRGQGLARAPGAGRPLPGGRHRGRRRRDQRRRAGRDRRDHGAHRAGGHPLGRQRLLAPAVLAHQDRDRRDPGSRRADSRSSSA